MEFGDDPSKAKVGFFEQKLAVPGYYWLQYKCCHYQGVPKGQLYKDFLIGQ